MPQILAAVGQLCSTANVARNGRICASIIRRAALAQAKLVHLPEAADFIAVKPEDVPDLAEPIEGGSFVEVIRNQARESKVWVGVGVHEKGPKTEPTKCYNTQLVRRLPCPLFWLLADLAKIPHSSFRQTERSCKRTARFVPLLFPP